MKLQELLEQIKLSEKKEALLSRLNLAEKAEKLRTRRPSPEEEEEVLEEAPDSGDPEAAGESEPGGEGRESEETEEIEEIEETEAPPEGESGEEEAREAVSEDWVPGSNLPVPVRRPRILFLLLARLKDYGEEKGLWRWLERPGRRKLLLLLLLLLAVALVVLLCVLGTHAGKEETKGTDPSQQVAVQEPEPDPAWDEAQALLENLTLEQKIGQMLMPAFRTWNGENVTVLNDAIRGAIQNYGLGGVILFSENTAGTASTTRLICEMQSAALSSASGLPLLMAVDQEGGYVVRLGTGTSLCGNMALCATRDPVLVKQAGAIIGSELAAEGFQIDFGPDVDINSNPANPVIGIRSFSDNPQHTATYGVSFVEGLHSENVGAALKHFPGHGDTATDSHSGLPCVNKSLNELLNFELVPFRAGILAGADVIMTAHIQYPQIETETYPSIADGAPVTLPATLSKAIITDLLRGTLEYGGVVCTDAMNMGAIANHFAPMDAARLAINAGVDILLMPVDMSGQAGIDSCGAYIQGIAGMVQSGQIDESTIDQAVLRILHLKVQRGLMDLTVDPEAQVAKALSTVGSLSNHESEWVISQSAVTMVKNEGRTLPFYVPEGGSAVLFCAYPNEIPAVNYAISRLKTEGVIPYNAEYKVLSYHQMTSAAAFGADLSAASAILATVETNGTSEMNPASSSGWQAAFLDDLIARTHGMGKRLAVVSLQLPYDLARYQSADALLAAYGAKGMDTPPASFDGETPTYGPNLPAAIYDAFGGSAPAGKLPVNVFRLDSNYNYLLEDILYPSGYGIAGWHPGHRFLDMTDDAYYADAVEWAVSEGITTGMTDTIFGPDEGCTRGQVVTFLWRAAGRPEPEDSDEIPAFPDVPESEYYADAVKWAVSEGITTGKTEEWFAPNDGCTRGQIVTFLARFAGADEGAGESGFDDVPASEYYGSAVKWAYEKGITTGTEGNLFGPENSCTRAQVVTFLARLMGPETES